MAGFITKAAVFTLPKTTFVQRSISEACEFLNSANDRSTKPNDSLIPDARVRNRATLPVTAYSLDRRLEKSLQNAVSWRRSLLATGILGDQGI